jgi:hypothetical protein
MTIEISCPYHGKIESLELPDSYSNFSGEVRCGSVEIKEINQDTFTSFNMDPNRHYESLKGLLKIRISNGTLVSVQLG